MARRKKSLKNTLQQHTENLSTQNDLNTQLEEAPIENAQAVNTNPNELSADTPETTAQAASGESDAAVVSDTLLEGATLNQWNAEGDEEALTDAAVQKSDTKAPEAQKDVQTPNVSGESAFVFNADEVAATEKPDAAQAANAQKAAAAASAKELEGDDLVQWTAEGDAEAVTNAAVQADDTKQDSAADASFKTPNVSGESAFAFNADEVAATQSPAPGKSCEALANASAQSSDVLEGDDLVQWVAEGDAEAVTNAAVQAHMIDKASCQTDTPAQAEAAQTAAAQTNDTPNVSGDTAFVFHADEVAPTQNPNPVQAADAEKAASAAAAKELEGDDLVQWTAEGDAEAVTNAAVQADDTKASAGADANFKTPNVSGESAFTFNADEVASTQNPAPGKSCDALANASAQSSDVLEGDDLVQWIAQGDAEAVTNAAVQAHMIDKTACPADGSEQSAPSAQPVQDAPADDVSLIRKLEKDEAMLKGMFDQLQAQEAALEALAQTPEIIVEQPVIKETNIEETHIQETNINETSIEETQPEEAPEAKHGHPIEKDLPTYLL